MKNKFNTNDKNHGAIGTKTRVEMVGVVEGRQNRGGRPIDKS
jgi:hypothetical protein